MIGRALKPTWRSLRKGDVLINDKDHGQIYLILAPKLVDEYSVDFHESLNLTSGRIMRMRADTSEINMMWTLVRAT